MLAYWLLGLAPLLALAYVVWAYRKKAVAQAAASSERFEQIFGTSQQGVTKPVAAPGPARVPAPRPAAAGGSQHSHSRKDRLLSPHHAQLLNALKSALPHHEIFAHVSLMAMLEAPSSVQGREREQRLRALAQHTVDCVVCDREMRVIAAVELEMGDSGESRFKSECLTAAGVRYVRINPVELPPMAELRSRMLGDAG